MNMRPKSAIKQLHPLLQIPSFTTRDAARVGVNSATLGYYAKSGELERIDRGIYRSVHAPIIENFRWEDLIVAAQKVKGGVICLTSALAFYELTEEIPRQHWIAIENKTRHRADPSTKIVRMRNLTLGKTEEEIDKITVSIFDRERTIVDSFRYLSRETAIKSLKMAMGQKGTKKIDLEKIRKYAKLLRVKIEPYILAVTT